MKNIHSKLEVIHIMVLGLSQVLVLVLDTAIDLRITTFGMAFAKDHPSPMNKKEQTRTSWDANFDGKMDTIQLFEKRPSESGAKFRRIGIIQDLDFDGHLETGWTFPSDKNILGIKEVTDPMGNLVEKTTYSIDQRNKGKGKKGIWIETERIDEKELIKENEKERRKGKGIKKFRFYYRGYNETGKEGKGGKDGVDQQLECNSPEDVTSQGSNQEVIKFLEDKLLLAQLAMGQKSFFKSPYGYYVENSCYEMTKESKKKVEFNDLLKNVFDNGLRCLESLKTAQAQVHLKNFEMIRQNKYNDPFSLNQAPKIICSDTNYDWTGTRGHASINEQNDDHPFISLSPNSLEKDSLNNLSNTLFHEAFHNFNHFHGDGGPDYCYACASCCFLEDGDSEEVRKIGCEICKGQYPKTTKDPLYTKNIVDFFLKSDRTNLGQKAALFSLEQNPEHIEGLYALVRIITKRGKGFAFGNYLAQETNRLISSLSEKEIKENMASTREELTTEFKMVKEKSELLDGKFPNISNTAETLARAFLLLLRKDPVAAFAEILKSKEVVIPDGDDSDEEPYGEEFQLAWKEESHLNELGLELGQMIFERVSDLAEDQNLSKSQKRVYEAMSLLALNYFTGDKTGPLRKEDREKALAFMEDFIQKRSLNATEFEKVIPQLKNYMEFIEME